MKCYICGCKDGLKQHELFKGARVTVCEFCERMLILYPSYGQAMRREEQSRIMNRDSLGFSDWNKHFGRSYL